MYFDSTMMICPSHQRNLIIRSVVRLVINKHTISTSKTVNTRKFHYDLVVFARTGSTDITFRNR